MSKTHIIFKQFFITIPMAASLFSGAPAHAVTNNIIQPISVESDIPTFMNTLANLINQIEIRPNNLCLFL